MRKTTRRGFLARTGIGMGAAMPASISLLGQEGEAGWIDSHVHVWDANRADYPISERFAERDIAPAVFAPADLERHQEGTGVNRTVLIQMSFFEFDNSYMLDVIENAPQRYRGVAIVDESQAGVADEMRRLASGGVRGFRLYAFPDRVVDWPESKGIRTMWETGAEEGLAMCCLTDPDALPVVHQLAKRHPDTRVVIDHFARIGMRGEVDPAQLDQLLAFADLPQVFVKVSAFYALGRKVPPYTDLGPTIRKLRDGFGSSRLMWGSDCPYQVQGDHSYAASVDLVTKKLDFLNDEEIEDLMQGTAETVFFS